MTRIRSITLAFVLIVGLVGAAAAPVAATHNGGDDSGLSDALTPADDGGISGIPDTVRGLASGVYARASYAVSSIGGDTPAAEESRDDAVATFNQYNDTFVQYLNNRTVHNGEVVEVTFVQGDEEATAYIVGTYNDSTEQYESAEAVTTTDRTVDHEIELRGMAADRADEELERFHDEFAEPDEDITAKYASEMAAKYKGKIDEPFTGGDA